MYRLTNKQKLNFILEKVKELDITSYDIGKKTNLSISGIDKIINGVSKNPHENTLNIILEFLESKVSGSEIGQKKDTNIINQELPGYEKRIKEIDDLIKHHHEIIKLLEEKKDIIKSGRNNHENDM